jgi:hypothetical protein
MRIDCILRLLTFIAVIGVLAFMFRSARLDGMPKLRRGLAAAGFSLLFFLVAINFVARRGTVDWYRMTRFGQRTEATITRSEPRNHATCSFQYFVAWRQYEESDTECHSELGQVIEVTYLPSEPSFATVQSPQENLAFVTIMPVGMSALAGLLAAFRGSRRR